MPDKYILKDDNGCVYDSEATVNPIAAQSCRFRDVTDFMYKVLDQMQLVIKLG